MAGKSVYLSEEQVEYLIEITDSVNAHDDEEKDETRAQIHEKLLK